MTQAVNLPNAWTEISLGEICHRITKGTTPTSLGFEFASEGILFVKVESLSDKNINHSLCSFISPEADEALSRSQLKENDILFSIAGTLGRVAIVRKDDLPANTNQALSIIRLIPPVYPPYIAEALSSRLLDATIRRDGRGVGIRNLNLKQVSEFSIPLPPLNEQRRIVAKIEELRAHTLRSQQALDEIPALIDQFRQSVLAAAFRGDLTADWRKKNPDVEPAEKLLERIREERRQKWEEAELEKIRMKGKELQNDKWKNKYKEPLQFDAFDLPNIPPNWCWMSLDQGTSLITDGEHATPQRTKQGIYLLSARNVLNGYVSLDKVDYISEETHQKLEQRLKVEPGDIFLSCSGTVGRSCVVPDGLTCSLVRSVAVLKPIFQMGQYVSLCLQSPTLQKQIEQKKTQTAQSNLFQGRIKILAVPLAPLEEQQQIIKLVSKTFEYIDSVMKTYEETQDLRSSLDQSVLAKAFRGELVPQDPNDEPASVLLDRIRAEREKLGTTKTKKRSSRKRTQ